MSTALRLFPQNPVFLLRMANLDLGRGNLARAQSLLERANLLDKESRPVWLSIVCLLVRQRNASKLRMVLNELFKQDFALDQLVILAEVLKEGGYSAESRCFVNRVETTLQMLKGDLAKLGGSVDKAEAAKIKKVEIWLSQMQVEAKGRD